MGVGFILATIKIAMILAIVVMIVAVWNRATTSARFFGIGLCCEFSIRMFQFQLASIFLISPESDWWHLLECIPLVFFIIALYTEFGWRVVRKPDNRRIRAQLDEDDEPYGTGARRPH